MITEISYKPLVNGVEDESLEFIEIYNGGTATMDLEDFWFTAGISFTFPDHSRINVGEHIIVAKDASAFDHIDADVYQWSSGSLHNQGETITLANFQGLTALNLVYEAFDPWPEPAVIHNYPIELKPGATVYQNPVNRQLSRTYGGTPGAPNNPTLLDDLYINEFMAKNENFITDGLGHYEDYIEIFNDSDKPQNLAGAWFSNDPDHPDFYQLPESDYDLTTILPGGFLVLWADDKPERGTLHLDFRLPSQGGEIFLSTGTEDDLEELDHVEYTAQTPDISYGRYPDGSSHFEFFTSPSPGEPNTLEPEVIIEDLYINEFVAKFGTLFPDEHGNFSDWIEIYNGGDEALDLAGLYLSDDVDHLDLYQIPDTDETETTIPAKGFLVFRADGSPDLGELHADFELSSQGETITIAQKTREGWNKIDQVSYERQTEDVSYGRYPDGSEHFEFFDNPTPGVSNALSVDKVENLYINEFVAAYGNQFPDEHGNFSDWIEIYNDNNEEVDLGGLYITDVIDNPYKCQFPKDHP